MSSGTKQNNHAQEVHGRLHSHGVGADSHSGRSGKTCHVEVEVTISTSHERENKKKMQGKGTHEQEVILHLMMIQLKKNLVLYKVGKTNKKSS